jgi:K+-transporting ATPase ATPase C chain
MKTNLIPCVKITLLSILLFGVGYPLLVTAIVMFTAPGAGDGVKIEVNGKVVGFDVIGQSFVSDQYFNGRPSAVGYNAAATGGSNKGPTNPDYLTTIDERIKDFLLKNPDVDKSNLPVDLITASGGGLDPHISPAAALVQVPRVAKVRGLSEDVLRELVQKYTVAPFLGIFGTPTVHVLKLNLALDEIKK